MGSLLVGSSNPSAMKAWYRDVLGGVENEMGAIQFGGVALFIEEHSEIDGQAKEPARLILDFDVADAQAWVEHLESKDVTWVRKVEESLPHIGTVEDPDGNYVQVIQWNG
jgi:hypothetical protein